MVYQVYTLMGQVQQLLTLWVALSIKMASTVLKFMEAFLMKYPLQHARTTALAHLPIHVTTSIRIRILQFQLMM